MMRGASINFANVIRCCVPYWRIEKYRQNQQFPNRLISHLAHQQPRDNTERIYSQHWSTYVGLVQNNPCQPDDEIADKPCVSPLLDKIDKTTLVLVKALCACWLAGRLLLLLVVVVVITGEVTAAAVVITASLFLFSVTPRNTLILMKVNRCNFSKISQELISQV